MNPLAGALACSGGGAWEIEIVSTFIGWSCLIAATGLFINALRMSILMKNSWWATIILGLLALAQPSVYSDAYHGDCGFGLRETGLYLLTASGGIWGLRYGLFMRSANRAGRSKRR